ncbi:MAG TPA: hypothetical protein VH853_11785 [Polyangia bacterium]|jgi:hypothetical protein|nr:hypothetical protein [Polyangia bacterium]
MSISTSVCNDGSDHEVLPPQTNPPACAAGQTFAQWVFCETCTRNGAVVSEENILDGACTQAQGLKDAQARFTDLDPDTDCSIDLCTDQD